jgi:hypothetical protein
MIIINVFTICISITSYKQQYAFLKKSNSAIFENDTKNINKPTNQQPIKISNHKIPNQIIKLFETLQLLQFYQQHQHQQQQHTKTHEFWK